MDIQGNTKSTVDESQREIGEEEEEKKKKKKKRRTRELLLHEECSNGKFMWCLYLLHYRRLSVCMRAYFLQTMRHTAVAWRLSPTDRQF